MAQILPTRWSMFALAFALATTLFVSRSQAQIVKSSIQKMSGWQSDLYFYLQTPQSSQALEFDVNQSTGSKKFIFGTQCNLKGGSVWDVWNARYGAWRSTGIPCYAPTAYKWHHLTWEFYRDSGMTHFISFTLDGVKHYVNRAYYAIPIGAQEINVAFQMDANYAQQDYAAWLDNVSLKYW